MKLIVMAPSGAPLLDGEALIGAARERFGERTRVQPSPSDWDTDFHIYVTLDGETLTISHYPDGTSMGVESGDAEVADAVAWLRSLLPPDFPRVIACDGGWNGHVELAPGITADQVMANWVDHSVPGWDAGDPDVAPPAE